MARRFRVTGRVQGVGFRMFVVDVASAEGLGGWVRNTSEGEVEGVVEGELASVDRFLGKIGRGPARARVDQVTIDEDVPGGRGRRFEVR